VGSALKGEGWYSGGIVPRLAHLTSVPSRVVAFILQQEKIKARELIAHIGF